MSIIEYYISLEILILINKECIINEINFCCKKIKDN